MVQFASIMSTATSASRQLNVFRMHHSQVPRERVIPAEALLLGAQRTVHLLLARIVDRVFVSREIVRSGEDGIAGLSRRRIISFTLLGIIVVSFIDRSWVNGMDAWMDGIIYLVWARLRVPLRLTRHPAATMVALRYRGRTAMTLTFVTL